MFHREDGMDCFVTQNCVMIKTSKCKGTRSGEPRKKETDNRNEKTGVQNTKNVQNHINEVFTATVVSM